MYKTAFSGGHINPAVSLTMAVLHRISWVQFIVYSLAQYLGAFVASATVYGVYYGRSILNNVVYIDWIMTTVLDRPYSDACMGQILISA